ncbi:MAG: hypothetical protein ACFCUN_14085 [Hyphomicrobiaceae bacterium]
MTGARERRAVTQETNEIARATAGETSSWLAGVASVFALIFSGVSLYHSVLKQPDLRLYLPDVLHYTRDAQVDGEVFIMPVTIANHGARDGTVLRLRLSVTDRESGANKVFVATYSVGEDYFVRPAAFDAQNRRFERVDRPRSPFAPISVPGRGHFSGTLLFYRQGGDEFPRLVDGQDKLGIVLTVETIEDASLGPIDDWLRSKPAPIAFDAETGYVDVNRLVQGATAIVRRLN